MKNIYKIILLSCVFTVISCKDAFRIDQVGRLGLEQSFQSVEDLESGILAVYDEFDHTPAIQFNALFTDELAIGYDNGGQGITDGGYGFVLDPSTAFPAALWVNYLRALNFSNRLLLAADGITPEEGEEDDYDDVVGATYALRAWALFEMLSYYSEDLEDDSSVGTIVLDYVPETDAQPARNTTGECFTAILGDITSAEGLLQNQTSTTFMSLDFCTALRARIAAYRGDYTTADAHAAALISDYSLADVTEYEAMYDDTDDTEVIFKLERAVGDNYDGQGTTGNATAGGWAGANFAFVSSELDGSPYFEMGRSLFNLLDPTDVRYTVTVDATSVIDTDYLTNQDPLLDILVISKYPGSGGVAMLNDLKIFRVSEMYLIRAEAAADAGNYGIAAGFIDNIRDARFGSDQTAPTYSTEAEAFAGILEERRMELMYEGHRYLDLKRLGVRAGAAIDRDPIDCAVNGACTLPMTDHRWTVPVPLFELDANTNIQQTAGY